MPGSLSVEPDNSLKKTLWWHPLLAGWAGGTSAGYSCYMFEQMKKLAESGSQQHYTALFHTLKRLYQNPGKQTILDTKRAFRLFVQQSAKGAHSFALTLAPTSIVQVSINNYLKQHLKKASPNNDSNLPKYVAGLISGGLGAFVSAPVEHCVLVQQREQCSFKEASKILTMKGPLFAWTGLKPLMIRESIFGFTMLTGSEAFGDWLVSACHTNQTDQPYLKFMGQITVGIGGALLSHPFDVIATRKQMVYQTPKQVISEPIKEPMSMIRAAEEIRIEHGWRGFWHGAVPRIWLFTGCMLIIGQVQKKVMKTLEDLNQAPLLFSQNPPFRSLQSYDIHPPYKEDSPGLTQKVGRKCIPSRD